MEYHVEHKEAGSWQHITTTTNKDVAISFAEQQRIARASSAATAFRVIDDHGEVLHTIAAIPGQRTDTQKKISAILARAGKAMGDATQIATNKAELHHLFVAGNVTSEQYQALTSVIDGLSAVTAQLAPHVPASAINAVPTESLSNDELTALAEQLGQLIQSGMITPEHLTLPADKLIPLLSKALTAAAPVSRSVDRSLTDPVVSDSGKKGPR